MTTVITHGGQFHCDDAMAVAILRQYEPDMQVWRSRDKIMIGSANIVVDVGGVYDLKSQRFDHHQVKQATDLCRPNGVPYAAAGLVWRHYGDKVVIHGSPNQIVDRVDKCLIQAIDAADCGFDLVVDPTSKIEGVRGCSLSGAIAALNPCWNEPSGEDEMSRRFMRAVELCSEQLSRAIVSAMGQAEARAHVLLAARSQAGAVLQLNAFCPWIETVFEERLDHVLFAVYKNVEGTFMVQCCPDKLGGFGKRLPLPADWGGKRDAEFAALTGVPDAIFCHPGCFIAGAKSKAGALRLAELALLPA